MYLEAAQRLAAVLIDRDELTADRTTMNNWAETSKST